MEFDGECIRKYLCCMDGLYCSMYGFIYTMAMAIICEKKKKQMESFAYNIKGAINKMLHIKAQATM